MNQARKHIVRHAVRTLAVLLPLPEGVELGLVLAAHIVVRGALFWVAQHLVVEYLSLAEVYQARKHIIVRGALLWVSQHLVGGLTLLVYEALSYQCMRP